MADPFSIAVPPVPTLANNFQPTAAETPYPYPVYLYGMSVLTTPTTPIPLTGPGAWTVQQADALGQVLGNSLIYGGAMAAPQVGESWSMFIVTTANVGTLTFPAGAPAPAVLNEPGQTYQVFINPVVTPVTVAGIAATYVANEECLSYPNYPSAQQVNRPTLFTFSFTTIQYTTDSSGNVTPSGFVHYDSSQGSAGPLSLVSLVQVNNPPTGFTGISAELAWLLPHETDHTNGIIFTDPSCTVGLPMTGAQQAYLTNMDNGTQYLSPPYPVVDYHGLVPLGTSHPTSASVSADAG